MPPLWQDEEPQWGVDEPEVTPEAAPAAAGEVKEGEAPADGTAPPTGEEAPVEDPDSLEGHKYNRYPR